MAQPNKYGNKDHIHGPLGMAQFEARAGKRRMGGEYNSAVDSQLSTSQPTLRQLPTCVDQDHSLHPRAPVKPMSAKARTGDAYHKLTDTSTVVQKLRDWVN